MSGSGKTTWARQEIKRRRKDYRGLVVWDPDEDHDVNRLYSCREFARALARAFRSGKQYRLGLAVEATRENFEFFCACLMKLADARAPILVVVEELADVTSTAKAGKHWGQLSRRGRKYGLDVIATTQRPQEADKTFINQAAITWAGVMKTLNDRKVMAGELDVSIGDLSGLKPLQYFMRTGTDPAKPGRVNPKAKV